MKAIAVITDDPDSFDTSAAGEDGLAQLDRIAGYVMQFSEGQPNPGHTIPNPTGGRLLVARCDWIATAPNDPMLLLLVCTEVTP